MCSCLVCLRFVALQVYITARQSSLRALGPLALMSSLPLWSIGLGIETHDSLRLLLLHYPLLPSAGLRPCCMFTVYRTTKPSSAEIKVCTSLISV